jgi:hypothetical protein
MAYQYRGTLRDVDPEPTQKPTADPSPFDPSKCGSVAGWKRHLKFGNTVCPPCKEAINAYQRDYQARRRAGIVIVRGFNPDMCGTTTGYSRHKRHDVPTCSPCLAARAVYKNDYNAKRRAA